MIVGPRACARRARRSACCRAYGDCALRQLARELAIAAALRVGEAVPQLARLDPRFSGLEVARHRGQRRRRVFGVERIFRTARAWPVGGGNCTGASSRKDCPPRAAEYMSRRRSSVKSQKALSASGLRSDAGWSARSAIDLDLLGRRRTVRSAAAGAAAVASAPRPTGRWGGPARPARGGSAAWCGPDARAASAARDHPDVDLQRRRQGADD